MVAVLLSVALASDPALARGKGSGGRSGGGHFATHGSGASVGAHRYAHRPGVFVGGAFVGGYAYPTWWYYWPYYYPAAVPDGPIEYIEKTDDPASPRRGWLFCRPAMAYYPYVTDCAESWEFVPVQPPAP